MRRKIILKDYCFKLGVKRYHGIVHAEQGIPMFYSSKDGVIARLTFTVGASQFEEPIMGFIRNGEDAFILNLEKDDILEEDLRDYMLDITDNYAFLEDYLLEERIKFLPKCIEWLTGALITLAAGIVFFFLHLNIIMYVALGLTVLQAIILGSYIRVISETRIYDRRGGWFDTATGYTNLNGGYKVNIGDK